MVCVAVLVSSCYKYREFWNPFFYFFKKTWPDCPYSIYLGTDIGLHPSVKTISVGHDKGWASNTKLILKSIKEQYVILLLEDYLLGGAINTAKIQEYINHMKQYNIGYLRLFPCPGPNRFWPYHKEFGIINKGERYRVSLQPSIWNKNTLLSLLKDGENIWEMEIHGSIRSNFLSEPFLSKWRGEGIFGYIMGARKGNWTKEAFELCKKEGLI